MGLAHWEITQADAAEMQEAAVPETFFPELVRPHQHIRAGFAVEAEFPVAVRLQSDESQRGIGLGSPFDHRCVDTVSF